MREPHCIHAKMMGDIVIFLQVLRKPDAREFVQAIIKEVKGQWTRGLQQLDPQEKISEVPDVVRIVLFVWSLQCKCHLTTIKVKSYKAN